MKAIEFQAETEKGVIKIPKEYKGVISNHVKVIILYEEERSSSDESKTDETAEDKDAFFDKFEIKLGGFKFNREQANER